MHYTHERTFRTLHRPRQSGFVLMSVLFAAILVGIIVLYNTRAEQKIAREEQIQLTAARMNQWLEAVLAYYHAHGNWPYTLDNARQTSTLIGAYQSVAYFQMLDLVASYFMPASKEDYQDNNGCKPSTPQRQTVDITQSPTATAWSTSPSTCVDETGSQYLIRMDVPRDCYLLDGGEDPTTDCGFGHQSEGAGIVAQVPTKAIAQAIAAKLPNSYVEKNPDIQDDKHWLVHLVIPLDPTQSEGNSPNAGTFTSGYYRIQNKSSGHKSTSAFGNHYTISLYNQGGHALGLSTLVANTQGTTTVGNSTLKQNLSDESLYGLSYTIGSTEQKPASSHFDYNVVSSSNVLPSEIQYFNSSTEAQSQTTFVNCKGANSNGYPNMVVSTAGFEAPPNINNNNIGFVPYSNAFSSGDKQLISPAPLISLIGNHLGWTSCGVDYTNLDANGNKASRPNCVDFYPYSSLYGLETISAAMEQSGQTSQFSVFVMGMSTQAAGNIGDVKMKIADSLKEQTVSPNSHVPPTAGLFPGNNNSNLIETVNNNHYWKQRSTLSDIDNNDGILGINYFFFCNAAEGP